MPQALTTVEGTRLELVQGDITKQPDMDAIVNAANAQLRTGGGVAGAIHRAAGPGLEEECRPLAPIEPGEAVITSGHNLPNPYVIHCLGPVYGRDDPADQLLAACYRNAFRLAEDEGLDSIAFPALSTGAFRYPMPEAADVMMDTFAHELPEASLATVRVVLWSQDALREHERALRDRVQAGP